MNPVVRSRRWQLAFWGVNAIGVLLFWACASELSWVRFDVAFAVAWLSGFRAAVLVEIGTQ